MATNMPYHKLIHRHHQFIILNFGCEEAFIMHVLCLFVCVTVIADINVCMRYDEDALLCFRHKRKMLEKEREIGSEWSFE